MAPPPASTAHSPTLRIALLVVLAVVLVAGATAGSVEWLERAHQGEGAGAVDPAARALAAFDDQRLESLGLAAAELAADPEVAAAVAVPTKAPTPSPAPTPAGAAASEPPEPPAGSSPVTRALEDQLDRRQIELVVVRGPSGEVVASAGGPDAAVHALVASAAAVRAGGEGSARGALLLGDTLYLVAARRIEQNFEPLGVVAVADLVNQSLALQAKSLARAETAFVVLGGSDRGPGQGQGAGPAPDRKTVAGGARVAASTLGRGAADALLPALTEAGVLAQAAQGTARVGPVDLSLGGRKYDVEVEPVADPSGHPVAAQVTLLERGGVSPALRWVEWTALGAGLLALIVGLVGAPLIGRSTSAPLREVTEAAAVARDGDLAAASRHEIPTPLADLFRDLAETRALQAVVAAGAGAAEGAEGAAERRRLVVLVVELPRYGRTRSGDEPREVAERLGRDLLRVRRAVAARGGRVEAALGHRVLAGFDEDGGPARALGAAAEILSGLSEAENAFDEPVPPALALASGPVIVGGGEGARTMTGLPVQQAESLLREASSGDLILSKGIYKEIRERLEAAGLEVTAQRGLLTPQPVYLLDAERSGRAAEALGTAEHSPAGAELSTLAPGAVVAERFTLEARLEGTDARIAFLARDRETDARVVLEALRRALLADPGSLEELGGPIRSVLHVAHPAVARLVEMGIDGAVPFLVSERTEGPRLADVLARRGSLPTPAALRVARHLSAGLGAVHRASLAHGAVSPETVVLDPRGQARLTGLGLAALLPPPGTDPEADELLGSPRYLAPERLAGGEPTAAADVYAAGAVLVEVFTGRPIYDLGGGASAEALRERIAAGPPDPLDPTVLPEGLADVLARCLARDAAARYADADQLTQALAAVRS